MSEVLSSRYFGEMHQDTIASCHPPQQGRLLHSATLNLSQYKAISLQALQASLRAEAGAPRTEQDYEAIANFHIAATPFVFFGLLDIVERLLQGETVSGETIHVATH